MQLRQFQWHDGDVAFALVIVLVLVFFTASFVLGRTLDGPAEEPTRPQPAATQIESPSSSSITLR
jgi:hypothetical protein